ncbi:Protein of unknown function [Gryllus bimaculatus]|nr:Protein of unknown function [Gryllus bimaculatus]
MAAGAGLALGAGAGAGAGPEPGSRNACSLGRMAVFRARPPAALAERKKAKRDKEQQQQQQQQQQMKESGRAPAESLVGFLEDDNMEDIQLDVPQNGIENSSSHAQMSRKPEKKTEDRDVNLNKTQADVHKEESD